MSVTTGLARSTHRARGEPGVRFNALMGVVTEAEGLHASFGRQDGRKARGVDGVRKDTLADAVPLVEDSGWEPDGVTLQVRFCEEPGTNRRMAEILWHRRETTRPTANTNFGLHGGKEPAYSPTTNIGQARRLTSEPQ